MSGTTKTGQEQNAQFNQLGQTKVTNLPNYNPQFQGALNTASNPSAFNANNPTLNFQQPFSKTMDPIVQRMYSQGLQTLADQGNSRNAGIAQALSLAGGNNGSIISTLQNLNNIATAGNSNALLTPALQQQREYDIARQNILQAQNAQRLQQSGQLNQANLTARGQTMTGEQNLVNTLAELVRAGAGSQSFNAGQGLTNILTKTKKPIFSK
jgi:hypothetical protein